MGHYELIYGLLHPGDIIKDLQSLPVIRGYYLVVGGGKIGTSFTEHARKHSFPLVIVVDNDRNAPASSGTEIIKDVNSLRKLLEEKLRSPLEQENSHIYFYCSELDEFPFILSFGMPEYIVPAIPCHMAAYLAKEYLNYSNREDKTVTEIEIPPENKDMIQFFDQFVSHFPENIRAGLYPAQGIAMLSYARPGEICPDGCPGPEKFCPNFRREKPKTITNYLRDLFPLIKGWVFESYQMKPGIGAMKGDDMKLNLLEMYKYVHSIDAAANKIDNIDGTKNIFFIATSCNCHGVVNLFRICVRNKDNCRIAITQP
ncbi:hypothetical protein Metho_0764 [Methanomethylovorans hollandica DSM 15978]|uniref:Uncharacterized protein n=1 Tax=Methanomethylovorans hollandica (strain DSM 15978 / NBRC 107637 / DMS1) TaxID=867904 RepID=L0KY58_METHD|nr:hypothetical protein [Methanomethylovorans hollandica]AGB49013.1 hypothetical protein Metho_0764 [Methanomethylovorans hollandica DSM 15978]